MGLLALGLIWRSVRYALGFPVWGDEAFLASSIITRDLAGLAGPLDYGQIAPPGFLWMEWALTRLFGSGELVLRLVPYLSGVAGLVWFWRFCRRVATRRVALVAVAIMAASFYPARHCNEIKPYGLDLFVSLGLAALAWSVYREPRPAWRWGLWSVAATIAVWCSYPAVFSAVSGGVLLLVLAVRSRSPLLIGRAVASATISGLSWSIVAVTFARTQAQASAWLVDLETWRDAFPPLGQPWRLPWWLLDIHAGGMLAIPYGNKNFGSLPTFLLVVSGVIAVWRRRPRRALLWLVLGPLPVALVAAALRKYPYGTCVRVMMYAAPAICLLSAEGVVAILRLGRGVMLRRGPIVCAGLLGLFIVGFTIGDLCAPYWRFDDALCRRIIRQVRARTAPGDQWLVCDGATPLPHTPGMMLSRWVPRVAKFRYNIQNHAPVSMRWEPDPNRVEPPPRGRTWLIILDHGAVGLFPREYMAQFVAVLSARLGPPTSEEYLFTERGRITVHVFPEYPTPTMRTGAGG